MDELYALLSRMRGRGRKTRAMLGVDSNGLVYQAVAGSQSGRSEFGNGTSTGARSGECVGAMSCTDVFDRLVDIIRESDTGTFWLLGRESE